MAMDDYLSSRQVSDKVFQPKTWGLCVSMDVILPSSYHCTVYYMMIC